MSVSQPMRYVALGDSLTEGLGDEPWPDGTPRGWADRLAMLLDDPPGQVAYANLAVRGQQIRHIHDTQLDAARALRPDLVTISGGMNDLLRPGFDVAEIARRLDDMVTQLTAVGARVIVLGLPDLGDLLPVGRLVRSRVVALNLAVTAASRIGGAGRLPEPPMAVFGDRRAWSEDRLHLGALGHQRLADGVAATLGRPVPDWSAPLPGAPAPRTASGEVAWWRTHAGPWLGRRLRGRSSGDGRSAKRPALAPVRH